MIPAAEEAQISRLLAKYKYIPSTKKEVIDVVTNFRSLTYNLQKFVFNDFSSKELFCLEGTIPVIYKNNTYYIPICIWLMDTHPLNAPICFVKPTPNMQIKVSMYVDHNGKIYLPYLHDWQPHSSDLLSLIQVMIVTFGEFPPVYSKPKELQQPQSTPYPSNASFMPQPSGAAGGGAGAFPPYPTGSNYPPYPPYSSGGGVPPPLVGGGVGGAGGVGGVPGSGYTSYMNFPTPGQSSNPSPNSTGTITDEHIKASLLSAVEDKIRRRLHEKVTQYQAEIETLNRTKQELIEGGTKIDAILARLQREEIDLQKNIKNLRDKKQELEKSLEAFENQNAINPDEAVTTTAPVYKQLLNAYADEAATEDSIYYLGEALRSGVIDMDTFLKHVRQLSRKQFMLKATMQKCRKRAGLAG